MFPSLCSVAYIHDRVNAKKYICMQLDVLAHVSHSQFLVRQGGLYSTCIQTLKYKVALATYGSTAIENSLHSAQSVFLGAYMYLPLLSEFCYVSRHLMDSLLVRALLFQRI